MPIRDPFADRFVKNRPLDPWQVSSTKKFDFDVGFVKWIQKYLEARKVVFDVLAAKQWINGAKFNEKRYEDCSLQWEGYQESLKAPERPSLKPVVGDSGLSGGDLGGADQPDSDGVDDAVTSPSPSLEGGEQEDIPDEFKALEGESPQELQARRLRVLRAKINGFIGKK